MNGLTAPAIPTIKRLFAVSGNRCAFPKCTSTIVDEKKVVGKICHIKARNAGGARYDPNQTSEERHGYDNLILMCGRHHDVIDDDEEAYTVEYLCQLKVKHEQNAVRLSEDETEQGVKMLLLDQSVSSISQSGGVTAHTVNNYNFAPPQSLVELLTPAAITDEGSTIQSRTVVLPKLKITRRTERVVFQHLQSSWRLAQQWEHEAQTALVLWVENEFPSKGNGRDLWNVIASIRADQYDSFTVSRAYWLERRDNEVTIESGDKLGVLIGYFSGCDSFISHRNPYAASPKSILDDGLRAQGQKAELQLILRDSETMPLRITVTLAQMPSQTVVACKQLTITLPLRIVDMQDCG